MFSFTNVAQVANVADIQCIDFLTKGSNVHKENGENWMQSVLHHKKVTAYSNEVCQNSKEEQCQTVAFFLSVHDTWTMSELHIWVSHLHKYLIAKGITKEDTLKEQSLASWIRHHPAVRYSSPSSYTDVSDWSFITNLWLLGSMNSSPRRRKGSGVTVTTREKSSRLREKTWPWRRAAVTGSSLTSVHWRPLLVSRYWRVGPGLR